MYYHRPSLSPTTTFVIVAVCTAFLGALVVASCAPNPNYSESDYLSYEERAASATQTSAQSRILRVIRDEGYRFWRMYDPQADIVCYTANQTSLVCFDRSETGLSLEEAMGGTP
jgi:hypothetical protein